LARAKVDHFQQVENPLNAISQPQSHKTYAHKDHNVMHTRGCLLTLQNQHGG